MMIRAPPSHCFHTTVFLGGLTQIFDDFADDMFPGLLVFQRFLLRWFQLISSTLKSIKSSYGSFCISCRIVQWTKVMLAIHQTRNDAIMMLQSHYIAMKKETLRYVKRALILPMSQQWLTHVAGGLIQVAWQTHTNTPTHINTPTHSRHRTKTLTQRNRIQVLVIPESHCFLCRTAINKIISVGRDVVPFSFTFAPPRPPRTTFQPVQTREDHSKQPCDKFA